MAPPTPQVPFALVWHWPMESQHPFGHEVASHTHVVPLQRWLGAQARHAAPPVPHAAGSSVVMQVAPLQQPFGHEAALHTQAPAALHC